MFSNLLEYLRYSIQRHVIAYSILAVAVVIITGWYVYRVTPPGEYKVRKTLKFVELLWTKKYPTSYTIDFDSVEVIEARSSSSSKNSFVVWFSLDIYPTKFAQKFDSWYWYASPSAIAPQASSNALKYSPETTVEPGTSVKIYGKLLFFRNFSTLRMWRLNDIRLSSRYDAIFPSTPNADLLPSALEQQFLDLTNPGRAKQ